MTYQPLPVMEPRQHDEPALLFGARVLIFLLGDGLTATLADDALELADHAALYAVASRDIAPIALERLNAVKHDIASTLKRRALDVKATPSQPSVALPSSPVGGQRVARPVPVPRQPSPSALVNPF